MDWMKLPEKLWSGIKKYRYAVLVVVLGLLFMALPKTAKVPAPAETAPQPAQADLAGELAEILGRMEGVGRVEIMLTEASGSETVYQSDPGSGEGLDTVILSKGSGQQEGLIRQVNPPTYLGAIVVCQGGDLPTVRLRVVEAVSRVTGLGADQISVLKMN